MTGQPVPDSTGHVQPTDRTDTPSLYRGCPVRLSGPRPKRERTTKSAYPSSWRRLVADAIANGATCVDCGTDRDLEGDHELPVSRGGLSTRANLAIRCKHHNRTKGNRVTRYQLRVPWPVAGGVSTTAGQSGPPPQPRATHTYKTGTDELARSDAPTNRVTISRGNLGRGGGGRTVLRADPTPHPR
jgi:hypothetical protein